MDSKRAEILSAMQSVADDIRPVPMGSTSSPPGVTVDIGGINVRQIASARTGRGSQEQGPATPVGPTPDERRRDCQRRSVLRLLGVFLAFAAILPLYLVDILPDQIDDTALLIGFVSLVGSMACFAATTVYENACARLPAGGAPARAASKVPSAYVAGGNDRRNLTRGGGGGYACDEKALPPGLPDASSNDRRADVRPGGEDGDRLACREGLGAPCRRTYK